jgi:hypothetical protein
MRVAWGLIVLSIMLNGVVLIGLAAVFIIDVLTQTSFSALIQTYFLQ